MKQVLREWFVIGVLVMFTTHGAFAQPAPEDSGHNCAGVVVSSLAGPGFGAQVAQLAQLQAVDNLGLADCGENPRQNP